MSNNHHEKNRLSWNAATKQHHTHKPDLIEQYKNGRNNLYFEDMHLLGDLTGKTVVHLQCNDGQDTVSIAKHLGGDVTGIDISDYAIESAKQLSEEAEIPATFIRSDIFDWFDTNTTRYDVIYTSYGAVCWVSELARWAEGIQKTLKPGGKFVMIDFHPLTGMFEIEWSLKYDYMGGKPIPSGGVGDYVGDDFDGNYENPNPAVEFSWGISNILSSLLNTGLVLEIFREYPYTNGWKRFPDMIAEQLGDKQRCYMPPDKPIMPLMFSIVARKPED